METLRNRIYIVLILCWLLCNFHFYLSYVIKFVFSFYLYCVLFFPLFPKMTRPLSDTQPYPNATQTLSDDDPKLSTNPNAPRTMETQGATNAADLIWKPLNFSHWAKLCATQGTKCVLHVSARFSRKNACNSRISTQTPKRGGTITTWHLLRSPNILCYIIVDWSICYPCCMLDLRSKWRWGYQRT